MLLYYIFALTFAVEGGYSVHSVAFTDTRSGAVGAVAVSHDLGFIDTGVRGQIAWYQGDNEAYSMTSYGVRWFVTNYEWRVAPVVDIGADYIVRAINNVREHGSAMTYGLGLVVNIPAERLRVSPVFFYAGITDSP
jgi:hypothetical protein